MEGCTSFKPAPVAYQRTEGIEVSAATVGAVLKDLTNRYPGFKQHLYDQAGKLRS
jgi:hypothetical protein